MKRLLTLSATAAIALAACGGVTSDARQAIEPLLKDPASAQYREIYRQPDGTLCGEVNAKNELGGYVGFRRFMVDPGGKGLIDNGVDAEGLPLGSTGSGFPEAGLGRYVIFDPFFERYCKSSGP